jgi:short-subunit dehydrogenase
LVVVKLDLASLASVRQCAQDLLRTETQIHILVNNAGKGDKQPRIHLYRYEKTLFQTFNEIITVNGFVSSCSILPAVHH